jgi:arsenate reductase (thioredoxin)
VLCSELLRRLRAARDREVIQRPLSLHGQLGTKHLPEELLEHWGRGRFKAYSAGSFPKGAVHPLALDLLEKAHLDTRGLRSKSWDKFAKPGVLEMDFVFTVCDQAASEVCPVSPGNPVTAHWGVPDPAAVEGTEADKNRAFRYAFQALETRIKLFTSLRLEALDRLALKRKVDEIGHLRLVAPEESSP